MTWPVLEHVETCSTTGVDHLVSIGLPVRHQGLDRAPIIVCLDGPWMFGTVLGATRIMSMSGEAPEAVVVGLSFTDTSMGEYLRQRARWYTPTPYAPPAITGVKDLDPAETGRAAELQEFVTGQLIDVVTERLADEAGLVPTQRWLVGHSFSALFGLRVLLTDPGAFDRWLLASPSIWWDHRSILAVEQAHAEANGDLPARLFVSYGQQESEPLEPQVADEIGFDFSMGANVEELVAILRSRNHPNLDLTCEMLPGFAHSSVIGSAVGRGLLSLSDGDGA